MLLRYNLEEEQVWENAELGKKEFVHRKGIIEFGLIPEEGDWESILLGIIASHNLCKAVRRKFSAEQIAENKKAGKGRTVGVFSLLGTAFNVEMTIYMFEAARNILRPMSRKEHKELLDAAIPLYPHLTGYEIQKQGYLQWYDTYWRQWLKGACIGFNQKLEEARAQEFKKKSEITKMDSIVLRNDAALTAFQESEYKNLKQTQAAKIPNTDAVQQGKKAGRKLNIAPGIEAGGGSTPTLKA